MVLKAINKRLFSENIRDLSHLKQTCSIDYHQFFDNSKHEQTFQLIKSGIQNESSTGLVIITNVPEIEILRNRLFKSFRDFLVLPDPYLQNLQKVEYGYGIGWNQGGKTQRYKWDSEADEPLSQSFYANPVQDDFLDHDGRQCQNVWPTELMPQFETDFKSTIKPMMKVGMRFCEFIDQILIEMYPGYNPLLKINLEKSEKMKARLLHYKAASNVSSSSVANHNLVQNVQNPVKLASWHKDYSLATLLLSSAFINKQGLTVDSLNGKGLVVIDNAGQHREVDIPESAIAIQIGEIIEIMSAGKIMARPHAVINNYCKSLRRQNLALFLEPPYQAKIEVPVDHISFAEYQNIASLNARWRNNMTFREFYVACRKYYRQETDAVIHFYIPSDRAEYHFLSNFYEGSPFQINGKMYKTAEHYYQSQKFANFNEELKEKIIAATSPAECKRVANEYQMLDSQTNQNQNHWNKWEKIKVDVMQIAINEKFGQNQILKERLVQTGNAILKENSPFDYFWGGTLAGSKNQLGKLLMDYRERLRSYV
ncbi:gtp cyclohydrolase ii [Stylonychia lemnae]|uniref:Gtp cyclohydrolase ii n=1 Tax=Stylonychia lemnae TaxID=5949 RepID=A0A078AQA0_STYLE|nr:gtp cyclohydrolase ii [Stylonychia lemnae]|eukprot:CDW83123.1 gtp cyclohydrolase ii [Stylonychia lemnae]